MLIAVFLINVKGGNKMVVIEKSKKDTKLSSQTILIYGPAKIGKSTFASQFPNVLFIATEAGLNHLSVNKISCNGWEPFLQVCASLAKNEIKLKDSSGKEVLPETVCIDTIDNLTAYCTDYVCQREGVNHPADLPMGKGWALVTSEIQLKLSKLSQLPYGLVFISHSKMETVETKVAKYNRFTISLQGTGNRNVFLNMSDMILFLTTKVENGEERRIIRTKPSRDYESGDRTGLLKDEMPLDYKEVAKHFDK